MTDAVRVRPRRGLILDGIPRTGADIPAELAEDWIANQLVEPVPSTPVAIEPAARKKPAPVRRSPRGSGSTRPQKRRSSTR